MPAIDELIPDLETFLALEPEEVAPYLLQVAANARQNGMVQLGSVLTRWHPNQGHAPLYGRRREPEVERAVSEAWQWLAMNLFLVPAAPPNGPNGFMVLGRRGERAIVGGRVQALQTSSQIPKHLLHGRIANDTWLAISRGDLEQAVFFAFREVEIAVREAGGYATEAIGTELMRRAFGPGGALVDTRQIKAERDALAHLFAGAIGSYKNPSSHRTIALTDPKDAIEMVLLASHLLRIVDARSAARKAAAT